MNAGNRTYGQERTTFVAPNHVDREFRGAPFVGGENNSTSRITDGTAKTLMLSEGFVLRPHADGRMVSEYGVNAASFGSGTFTGWNPPNSRNRDEVGVNYLYHGNVWDLRAIYLVEAGFTSDTWPIESTEKISPENDASLKEVPLANLWAFRTRIVARSRHKGGVNASHCDGSVTFYTNDISGVVWAALSSARGGADEPQ